MIVQWRKSSRSGGVDDDACVELGSVTHGLGIRDSKNPDGGHLVLSADRFADLVERIKRGSYDW